MASRASCHSSCTFSARRARRLIRPFVGFAALTLMLSAAGCGSDDEPTQKAPAQATGTEPAGTTATQRPTTDDRRPTTSTQSPEDQPGGAGDEEPIRADAVFTGDGGAIRPRVVRVPPFIAIRVELRSRDGARYGLRFGDRKLAVGPGRRSDSASFAGVRPGGVVVGEPVGGGNRVRVEGNAEPGP
jgi:hypothetical protein